MAFYLKRLFFYGRTYTSTTKGVVFGRFIDMKDGITRCTVLIHTHYERRMSTIIIHIRTYVCEIRVRTRT